MAIRFCVFDVGQVCYSYSLDPLDYLMRKMSIQKDDFDTKGGVKSFNYNPFMKGEIDFSQFCKDLCFYCGVDYSKDMGVLIDEAMHKGVGDFYAKTLAIMSELRFKGIEVCLLSNALPNLSTTAQGLVSDDKIFVSYELGLLKPDVEIYRQVLKKLNARPEEVVFIDDKLKNVEAAKSIGIYGIVFNKDTIIKDVRKLMNCQPSFTNGKNSLLQSGEEAD